MKIKKEILEAKYEITELNQGEFNLIKLALNDAMNFISYHHLAARQQIQGSEKTRMDGYENLLKILNLQ